MRIGNQVEKVVKTILQIIFAYFNPFRNNILAILALKITKNIPVFLILFEILMHFLNI